MWATSMGPPQLCALLSPTCKTIYIRCPILHVHPRTCACNIHEFYKNKWNTFQNLRTTFPSVSWRVAGGTTATVCMFLSLIGYLMSFTLTKVFTKFSRISPNTMESYHCFFALCMFFQEIITKRSFDVTESLRDGKRPVSRLVWCSLRVTHIQDVTHCV